MIRKCFPNEWQDHNAANVFPRIANAPCIRKSFPPRKFCRIQYLEYKTYSKVKPSSGHRAQCLRIILLYFRIFSISVCNARSSRMVSINFAFRNLYPQKFLWILSVLVWISRNILALKSWNLANAEDLKSSARFFRVMDPPDLWMLLWLL